MEFIGPEEVKDELGSADCGVYPVGDISAIFSATVSATVFTMTADPYKIKAMHTKTHNESFSRVCRSGARDLPTTCTVVFAVICGRRPPTFSVV